MEKSASSAYLILKLRFNHKCRKSKNYGQMSYIDTNITIIPGVNGVCDNDAVDGNENGDKDGDVNTDNDASVMLVKIMSSSMCTGVFVLLEESPPAALTVQLCYFSLIYSVFSCFLCLFRLTWSQRGRCTWSLICLDLPLRVRLCNTLFYQKKTNKPSEGQRKKNTSKENMHSHT